MRPPTPAPVDQFVLELPGLPSPRSLVPPEPRRRSLRSVPTVDEQPSPPQQPIAMSPPERVWLVWEDDEVLGVYADRDTAAADCAALRRAARRAPLPVHYECLPVPVFDRRRHTARPV